MPPSQPTDDTVSRAQADEHDTEHPVAAAVLALSAVLYISTARAR